MGYFSSGAEGSDYQYRYCRNCANNGDEVSDNGCAVWDAHLIYVRDRRKSDKVSGLLDVLIPISEDGLRNEQCAMFRPRNTEAQ